MYHVVHKGPPRHHSQHQRPRLTCAQVQSDLPLYFTSRVYSVLASSMQTMKALIRPCIYEALSGPLPFAYMIKSLQAGHGSYKRESSPLTLSTLGKIFTRWHFEIFFLIFLRKQDMTFHANCLLWRQFAWTVKSCFLGKIRKISSIYHLLKMPRVVKVKLQ